jgi:predicted dehydrogenase
MTLFLPRRAFLKSTLATGATVATLGASTAVHGIVGSTGRRVREEKLRVAVIGVRNRGAANLAGVRGEQIVALCDVDSNYLRQAGEEFPAAKRYRDYRELIDSDLDIDCVVVSTPDHNHAPASAMALRRGRHVYCEKPLAHTIDETRTLGQLGLEPGLATQMGTQVHAGDNYRRVVEIIRSGAIGDVTAAHAWVGKTWSDGRLTPGAVPPAQLDWNLWLGPKAEVSYIDGIHPANWRKYWNYGTGTLGDMGCHYLDLVQWALELGAPTTVRAEGPAVDEVGTPSWCHATWTYPQRGSMTPCTVEWWDGGRRPEALANLKRADGSPVSWGDGHLFIGTEGMLLSDYGRYVLFPEEKFSDFSPPEAWIPRSRGHHAEFLHAARTGAPTLCNFPYAAQLTENVLLGTVAYRAGRPLEWDGRTGRTDDDAANELLSEAYREGWAI